MEDKRFGTIILILVVSTTVLGIAPEALPIGNTGNTSNTTIRSSGMMTATMPLHVEGPYIKDSSGNTVSLRGVNKVEWADQPGGTWMGKVVNSYTYWNPTDVATELDAMKSWGINVIRSHQAVEQWLFDMGQHRQMLKEFIQMAADRGMYVIYDGYSIRNYANGATQDPLPYPPYQTTPQANTIITSEQDYIDYMASVASELKTYPNVIFELWNEPYGDDTAKTSWFDVSQRCINAIRATGASNLIIFQWNMNVWVNLDFPNGAQDMDWLFEATCPRGTNVVYSTHIYRTYGAFHRTASGTKVNCWNLTDITLAFQYFRFADITAQYPLIVGEIGADMAYTGDELTHELSAFDTCMTLFDQMGIHYLAFWWRGTGIFRLHNGSPSFTANVAGQILYTHLQV